ncbi:MAG: hypothetical protein ACOC4M_13540, partial [Promethearchaeia archaeon]
MAADTPASALQAALRRPLGTRAAARAPARQAPARMPRQARRPCRACTARSRPGNPRRGRRYKSTPRRAAAHPRHPASGGGRSRSARSPTRSLCTRRPVQAPDAAPRVLRPPPQPR